jgi:uncharacterized membrane protein
MDDVAIARAIHVLAVVVWIGGLAMVTTVVLPLVRRSGPPMEPWALFQAVERRFAWQARTAVVLVGASGLYMVWRLDLWDRFRSPGFWWMHAMVLLWLIFAVVLFAGEPLAAGRLLRRARTAPDSAFAGLQRLHWVLLGLSAVTVIGAVLGAYGTSLFP